ncbi:hypothetical protein [Neorhizobium huautlense]|uniref:hypothetical protein n=1 Tax=Neorhizobium huautlense TaxID=67774 RepID=UPI00130092B9|nr:hypothetical protein [Neorhizobium huautlense]
MPEFAMHNTGTVSSFNIAYIGDRFLNRAALSRDHTAGLFRGGIAAAMHRLSEAPVKAGKAT